MRDRRTETIENSAATKKALIAIKSSTANNRDRTSVQLSIMDEERKNKRKLS